MQIMRVVCCKNHINYNNKRREDYEITQKKIQQHILYLFFANTCNNNDKNVLN